MPESTHSPLARIVLFMVCLSIAGTCIAGISYFAVVLPGQNNVQAPANTMMTCPQYCDAQYFSCIPYCKRSSNIESCRSNCLTEYTSCKNSC